MFILRKIRGGLSAGSTGSLCCNGVLEWCNHIPNTLIMTDNTVYISSSLQLPLSTRY